MKVFRSARACLLALSLAALAPAALSAQGLMDRIKAKAKEKVDAETDKAIDKGLDNATKCVMGDAACIKSAQDAGKPVTVTDKKGNKVSTADSAKAVQSAAPAAAPTAAPAPDAAPAGKFTDGIALNFDFIPGDKVIFFEDFANDKVGDLPEHIDVTSGNFSVASHKGRKALVNTEGGTFTVKLPQILPDRFTIEMEYHLHIGGNPVKVWMDPNRSIQLGCWQNKTDIYFYDGGSALHAGISKQAGELVPGGEDQDIATCRYMVDKGYAKAFWGGTRTAQLNGLSTGRADKIEFEVPGTGKEDPFILYNVRVAAGGKKLWDAISAAGRASVNGILFDTGSDHIRAESTPVLKEIAGMLRDHAELKLLVEGHTDNVGGAASNLALSDKRAAAVKAWLVEKEQIAATRLTTKGMGDAKPAAPNTSAEGRQNNRRVELVKQP